MINLFKGIRILKNKIQRIIEIQSIIILKKDILIKNTIDSTHFVSFQ